MVNGDQSATIESAFVENRAILLKWLTGRLGNAADADDVLQSVYLRVWNYAGDTLVENPRALIFKTAAHLATNELVRRRRVRMRVADDDSDAVLSIECGEPTPEERILYRQDVQRSLAAIRNLPPKIRQAFEMSRFEGKTYAEIALALDVSESSVEKYMIEALKRLRTELRPGEGARLIPFARAGRQ